MPLLIGVDPGLSGAISFYWPEDKFLIVQNIPTTGDKKKRSIDCIALSNLFPSQPAAFAYVEAVHAMVGWGSSSSFRFGQAKGTLLGMLGAFRVPVRLVSPQKWKKSLGLDRSKTSARKLAAALFPDNAKSFALVKDEHKAEAALIVHYGFKELRREGHL